MTIRNCAFPGVIKKSYPNRHRYRYGPKLRTPDGSKAKQPERGTTLQGFALVSGSVSVIISSDRLLDGGRRPFVAWSNGEHARGVTLRLWDSPWRRSSKRHADRRASGGKGNTAGLGCPNGSMAAFIRIGIERIACVFVLSVCGYGVERERCVCVRNFWACEPKIDVEDISRCQKCIRTWVSSSQGSKYFSRCLLVGRQFSPVSFQPVHLDMPMLPVVVYLC